MNCNIARDLLASYNDGLLEEETVKDLEAHLKDCPECRKLNELYAADIETKNDKKSKVTKEKAFKKVKRKLRKNRIIAVVSITLASLLMLGAVILSIGQVVKNDICPSWEALIRYAEVSSITKSFAEGDMESFYNHMYRKSSFENNFTEIYRPWDISDDSINVLSSGKSLDPSLISMMEKNYEKEFKSRKIKKIRTDFPKYYDNYGFNGYYEYLGTVCLVEMDDGGMYQLNFLSMGNSEYRIEVLYKNDKNDFPVSSELANCCNFVTKVIDPELMSDHKNHTLRGCMRVFLTMPEDDYYIKSNENGKEKYSSHSYEKFVILNASGFKTDYCDTGMIWYDPSEDKFVSSWLTEVTYENNTAFLRFSVEYSPDQTFIRKGSLKTYNNDIPEDKLKKLYEIIEMYEK